ncbi:MAG TPA: TylF/MycF/NovP-related O-methyltransferase [Acidimicrobiales bacterium]|jgi:O-methyltransferase|nr:TylF/MycF/NovP-related O-methyltransferase [Acidimicrobiales bacterium]
MLTDEPKPPESGARLDERYLQLLKHMLTRSGFQPETIYQEINVGRHPAILGWAIRSAQYLLARRSIRLMGVRRYDPAQREVGADWPDMAETMVGLRRLDALQACLETIFKDNVPGDILEAGVWRGGSSIFMRGVLAVHNENDRHSWLADSFMGVPAPDVANYPADEGMLLHTFRQLAVPKDEVRRNFERYDLLDENVHFLEGWFKDTLPGAPIGRLALLRLDGDLYESTILPLEALYDKVSPGGFVVIDDYYNIEPCRRATDTFRQENEIMEPVEKIDWCGAFWRKGYPSG